MKLLTHILFSTLLLTPTLATSQSLADFELNFISTLNFSSPSTISLIGYKTIPIPTSELPSFNTHYKTHLSQWSFLPSTYYDQNSSSLRVYFPVEGALLSHNGQLIEANPLGELSLQSVSGDLAVVGRYQTDFVTGVEGNIIQDGIIYLATPNLPTHKISGTNTYVYDFGVKKILDHDHDHEKRDGKVSCISNHGGENCSDKYNIHNGRCPRRHDTCVDYNGLFTDCKKGGSRVTNFPDSDCFTSLAEGHCWNEVM